VAETGIGFWIAFLAFTAALLAFDLGVLHRRDHVIRLREALLLSTFYIALALLFAALVFYWRGSEAGIQFLTGYLIEKSLSIDNIFVIVLTFTYFAVPPQYQHRVLFYGIIGAVVMRGILIVLGVQLIHSFAWIAVVFGAFLIFTGIKMLIMANAKADVENNVVVRLLRKRLRITQDYVGHDFFTRRDGLLYVTPLFVVLVLIEFTDVIFAVDSIPAILAISQDPFIIFTANVFAILGLRALYFALADIVPRFVYLKYGLSLILVFIGGKMIANYFYGGKFIPTHWALLATAILIAGSIALSLLRTRTPGAVPPLPTGWIPGSRPTEADEARKQAGS
jgi:tellurite resistance protein TerC